MNNKILLMCTECSFRETGFQEKELMNKIIMWTHMKKAHPHIADQMTRYKVAPEEPYKVQLMQ